MTVINMWRGSRVLAASLALTAFLGTNLAMADVSWAVFDAKAGRFLGTDNAEKLRPPASLAKMMTLYLTFEAIRAGKLSWDDQLFVSRNAADKIPTKLGLKANETVSVRDAVNGMIVISANDAATAVAEHISGSEAAFGRLMTERAKNIGMKDTVFSNPSGLTDGEKQLTTARDMAMLGIALERDFPKEFRLFSQPSIEFRGQQRKGHNNLMYRYGVIDGIKTGYTTAAGFNLVSSLRLDNGHLIGVVLGGQSARSRDEQMEALLKQFSTRGEGTAESPMVAGREPIDESLIEQGDGGIAVAALPPQWRIQVAALPTKKAAEGMLGKASRFVRAVDTNVVGKVDASEDGGLALYRVRFDGFASLRDARGACTVLKRQKFDCIAVKAD